MFGILVPLRNNQPFTYLSIMIDAHVHLCDEVLYANAAELIQAAKKKGVHRFLCVVTQSGELSKAIPLKKAFPELSISASTTPHEAATLEDPFFKEVQQAAQAGLIQAIGETGLEYFHPGLNRDYQKSYLLRYIQLSHQTQLPLVFHCREAFADLFSQLKPYKGSVRGMIHCFTGNLEEALQAIDYGLMISLSGIVTFKKSQALQRVVQELPLDKILIETDSPYLAPQSKRGQLNQPVFIEETYRFVAALKEVSFETLCKQIEVNFQAFIQNN